MRLHTWLALLFLTFLSSFALNPMGVSAAPREVISTPMPDVSEWQGQAQSYLGSLTNKGSISWDTYSSAVRAADVYASQQKWSDAIQAYETAAPYSTSYTYEFCRVWGNLAALHFRQSGPSDKAMAAAYNVVRLDNRKQFCQDGLQAVALGIMAQGYVKRGKNETAIALFKRSLALKEDPDLREKFGKLGPMPLTVDSTSDVDTSGAQSRICLKMSAPLLEDKSVKYEDYVKVSPSASIALSPEGKNLCIEGLDYSQKYKITLRKGMPGLGNSKITSDLVVDVTIPGMESRLSFRGNGYILPRVGGGVLPMVATNVAKAEIHILRINDRSLIAEIRDNGLRSTLYGYRFREIAQDRGEWVWSGDMDIKTEQNKQTVTAIPLNDILKKPQPGIYAVFAVPVDAAESTDANVAKKRLETSKRSLFGIIDEAMDGTPANLNDGSDDEGSADEYYNYDDYYTDRAVQWLMVSDIGLSAFQGTDGMTVSARSFATGQSVGGLDVRLYARNNAELARAKTDSDGLVRFPPGLFRAQGGNTPFMVMAFGANDDFSVLELNRPAFDLTDRGVGGREAPGALDAFLYTDRGIYRPGETVRLSALLRDNKANAVDNVPVTFALYRPDGVLAREITGRPNASGGISLDLPFDKESATGSWTVSAVIGKKTLNTIRFSIEDFVPDRIRVTLTKGQADAEGLPVNVEARYLYDAPAVELQVDATVTVLKDSNPFEAFAKYTFGMDKESFEVTRTDLELDLQTDEDGKASFVVPTDSPPDSTFPMTMRVSAAVSEEGGRAVRQSLLMPLRPKDFYIGLKAQVDDWRAVPEDSTVGFDIVAVNGEGNQVAAQGLNYTLYREDWRYQWAKQNNGLWQYNYQTFDKRVSGGQINAEAGKPATLSLPVRWGSYRLEVTDSSGAIASSISFEAGWGVSSNVTDTPDTLKISSDKASYNPGEKAKISLTPPFEGEVLLTVLNDKVLYTQTFSVPAHGRVVEVPVTAEWGVGAYVTASVFRPAEKTESRMPGRAVGLTWVAIDPAPRSLKVAMDLPKEVLPRQKISVPITVTGAAGDGEAFVTVALVDEGILQITDFATPDPAKYYYGKRRLAVDLRDSYGNLIDPRYDQLGVLRSGGDMDGQRNKNISETVVKPLALFSGIVTLDKDGKAVVTFDIPDFNGQVRLMAVAYSKTKVGNGDVQLIVRDPMVVQASLPRFMAPGDVADMTITLNNVSGASGNWKIAVTAEGALTAANAKATFDLVPGKQASHRANLKGVAVGVGRIVLDITAPDGTTRQSTWTMSVRPLQAEMVDRMFSLLKPGEKVTLTPAMLDDMLPGTGALTYSVSAYPNLDVVGLLQSLDRYPYGCLEQTTSRALPLLYMNEVAALSGNSKEGWDKLKPVQQKAIARILGMQTSEGGFGMWSSDSYVSEWGTAYAMDFLIRARDKGFDVPEAALARGVASLRKIVNFSSDKPSDYYLATAAYGLYVLSAVGEADAGSLRYFNDNRADALKSPIAKAQLAAALAKVGEMDRAKKTYASALEMIKQGDARWADVLPYGSFLRDLGAMVSLGAEVGADEQVLLTLADSMTDQMMKRRHYSTQEQAWLLMAANALYSRPNSMKLEINGAAMENNGRPLNMSYRQSTLTDNVIIANKGEKDLRAVMSVAGSPMQPLPAESNGYTITRSLLNLDGTPVDMKKIRQTDSMVVVIEGTVTAKGARHETMLIDFLPAGLEVENSRISDDGSLAGLSWLTNITASDHMEIRDDRYVTTYRLGSGSKFRAAYLVRAVTPGTFGVPPAYVEDMYSPELRARGDAGSITILPRSKK